ncbi:MAG: hypothetical protein WBV82_11625 [Myxococcaceae bacterium]
MKTLRPLTMMSLLLVAACSTTQVTNAWKDPTFDGPAPKKVLVVGQLPDETSRRILEQELTSRIVEEGGSAVPSSEFFAEQSEIDSEALREVAEREDFDAVLVSRYLGEETTTQFVPDSAYGGGSMYGDPWYAPGHVYQERQAKMETGLFDIEDDGTPIWSVTTETLNPNDSEKQTRQLASKIVRQMEKDALL